MNTERSFSVDTLRGLACILLVAYHVVGSNYTNGLRISDGVYRELNDLFALVRMPLFTFLSGYIYATRPYQLNLGKYVKGKVNRLIIPMLTVGTVFAVIQHLVPASNQGIEHWYLLHILPVAHFWFIEAIFFIFILMIPLEKYKLLSRGKSFSIIFVLSSLLYVANIQIHYFAISGVIYLLPFFLVGLAVQRFDLLRLINKEIKWGMSIIICVLMILLYNDKIPAEFNRGLLSLFIGCVSCYLLLAYQCKSTFLAKIGVFSYSIYLYHVFFTAGSRIVFSKFGMLDVNILFILSLVLGILGPIIVEFIFSKNKYTSFALLGKNKH
ncbi:acyltransferase [Colwellia sp. E2M01]|uniref:acyltransferase family protein n=1 Tax=Colwellia sp. E2M01 TaxID=2841561 RepID=UPI001C08633E|nr:acyltransferase [Colwellia sp. E2M01]MBU2870039.1 acyltransferase [Colwellia sp. E2M01]